MGGGGGGVERTGRGVRSSIVTPIGMEVQDVSGDEEATTPRNKDDIGSSRWLLVQHRTDLDV